MASFTITIKGFGSHHNINGPPGDADSLAAKLVRELVESGHRVEVATWEGGQTEDLKARVYPQPAPVIVEPVPDADDDSRSTASA